MPEKNVDQYGISVVCPTYNCSTYIQRTIESLLNQTELPNEVIFSDDGSDDDTVNIIEKNRDRFEESSIQLYVERNDHQGPGAARNNGIAIASQLWIAFLDADDVWKNEKISHVRKAMHENCSSNCFLHWEEYVKINGDRQPLKHGLNYYDPDLSLLIQLYQKNFLSTSAVVCKKKLVQNAGGFDTTLPNAQDLELWLKMSSHMNLTVLPEILGEYIEELGSISARPYYNRFWTEIRIALRYRKKVSLNLFLYRITKIILSKQWFYTFFNMFNSVKKHNN
jgi:glycosyltransferase involved in cell wall biosynthesis|tara:strand:- start:20 stop:859 length:840 start_codon:yes stop_codon:yes gene_type:complete